MADHPGILYAIENTAWPGWVKVGRAEGPERDAEGVIRRRLYQYNTGDPLRGYVVIDQAFASCCHDAERFAHSLLEVRSRRGEGEWFSCSPNVASKIIQQACAIGRLAPQVRGDHFLELLTEARQTALQDTDLALVEGSTTRTDTKRLRREVATAACEAQRLISLLAKRATPDASLRAEIEAVMRRLDALGDIA